MKGTHNNCSMLLIVSILLSTLSPITTLARPARYYAIEIIAFAHKNLSQQTKEYWHDVDRPAPHPMVPLAPSREQQREMQTDTIASLPGILDKDHKLQAAFLPDFQAFDSKQFKLKQLEKRISSNKDYQSILHSAWRQRVVVPKKSTWVHITSADKTLDGYIHLSRIGPYLYLKTDVSYNTGHEPQPFIMQETRRLHSKELHYFDHPLFGLLVWIEPADYV